MKGWWINIISTNSMVFQLNGMKILEMLGGLFILELIGEYKPDHAS